jgi:hypothetical protein
MKNGQQSGRGREFSGTGKKRASCLLRKVQVRLFVSINGRKPQLFIDPNIDLVAEPRRWGRPRWLLQIYEPLPDHPVDSIQRPFESSQ